MYLTYSECDILLVLNSTKLQSQTVFHLKDFGSTGPARRYIIAQNIVHFTKLISLLTGQVTRSELTSVIKAGPGLGSSVSAATSCVSLHRSQSHSPVSRFSKLLRNSFSKLKSRTVPKTSLRSKSRSRTTIIDSRVSDDNSLNKPF